MAARKGKGAVDAAPAAPEAAPSFVLVTNTRGGTIYAGSLKFEPGSSVHDSAVFSAFPATVQDALTDMVNEGWLRFEGSDVPVAPLVAPAELPSLAVESVATTPSYPTAEQVNASTSPAELDAWFSMPGLPVELSELVMARHTALSPA